VVGGSIVGGSVRVDPVGVDALESLGSDFLSEDGEGVYLYVYQSLEFVEAVGRSMNARMIWIAVFVFVLTFALSSTISGVLSRPLDEIAGKAKRLATGDFEVDFKGEDYFEEMEALSASLNYAKDELSKADRMQKELLANVTHDFKTPLTMIKAYAEMIVEFAGENKEKRDRSANVIIEEADRLSSLVNDMLDLSKIRAGIQALQFEEFDVSVYLREILARFDYLAETQGYRFCVDVDEGLYTFADKQKLGQVMYNLIGNALNYTGDDKTVRVRLKKESEAIRFEVSDSGRGIPEEELSEIWERYYRSSETHKRPVKGTGLGLSIVKTILEKHAFRFGVNSVVGVGSSFYAFFPLRSGEPIEGDNCE
jgi:signal transduction histidine kinase